MDPVLYHCTGTNEHNDTCGKLLLIFKPPVDPVKAGDLGQIEVKCRRCRTMNFIRLADAIGGVSK